MNAATSAFPHFAVVRGGSEWQAAGRTNQMLIEWLDVDHKRSPFPAFPIQWRGKEAVIRFVGQTLIDAQTQTHTSQKTVDSDAALAGRRGCRKW